MSLVQQITAQIALNDDQKSHFIFKDNLIKTLNENKLKDNNVRLYRSIDINDDKKRQPINP